MYSSYYLYLDIGWTTLDSRNSRHCGLLGRFAKFLGVLTLESFTSTALGLAVGAAAPNTDAAVAIGPAVMVVFIVFGGTHIYARMPVSVCFRCGCAMGGRTHAYVCMCVCACAPPVSLDCNGLVWCSCAFAEPGEAPLHFQGAIENSNMHDVD